MTFVNDGIYGPSSEQETTQEQKTEASIEGSDICSSRSDVETAALPPDSSSSVASNKPRDVAAGSYPLQCPHKTTDWGNLSSLEFMDSMSCGSDMSSVPSLTVFDCKVASSKTEQATSARLSCLISDRTEAQLLRHYCQTLAPWVRTLEHDIYQLLLTLSSPSSMLQIRTGTSNLKYQREFTNAKYYSMRYWLCRPSISAGCPPLTFRLPKLIIHDVIHN